MSAPAEVLGAGFLLAQLGRLAAQEWSSFLAATGVSQLEFAALVSLRRCGPLRQRQLAQEIGVDPRNAVALVSAMTQRRLVSAVPDPHDRRSKVLALAPTGAKLLAASADEVASRGARFLGALSAQDQRTLLELLTVLYQAHTPDRTTVSTDGLAAVPAPPTGVNG